MNIRKYILISLSFISFSSMKAQSDCLYHHCLFPESSFIIGGSAIYGFDFVGAGINGRFYYNMNERFCFGPEFSYLSATNKDLYDINLIAHYIFDIKGIGAYPVGGINYSIENEINELHDKENIETLEWLILKDIEKH